MTGGEQPVVVVLLEILCGQVMTAASSKASKERNEFHKLLWILLLKGEKDKIRAASAQSA